MATNYSLVVECLSSYETNSILNSSRNSGVENNDNERDIAFSWILKKSLQDFIKTKHRIVISFHVFSNLAKEDSKEIIIDCALNFFRSKSSDSIEKNFGINIFSIEPNGLRSILIVASGKCNQMHQYFNQHSWRSNPFKSNIPIITTALINPLRKSISLDSANESVNDDKSKKDNKKIKTRKNKTTSPIHNLTPLDLLFKSGSQKENGLEGVNLLE